jgi:alanine racemase
MRRNAQQTSTPEAVLSGQVSVDLSAISDNVRALRALSPAPHFMAVVKGNGYGHGLIDVARAALAAGADWLGTARLTEALALRRAGITAPVLSWLYLAAASSETMREAVSHDVDMSLGSIDQLDVVAGIARSLGRPAAVHLELDSGLSRGGARAEDWPDLVAAARQAELAGNLTVRGIWTHLAWADVPAHPGNAAAVDAFEAAVGQAREAGLDPGTPARVQLGEHPGPPGIPLRHGAGRAGHLRPGPSGPPRSGRLTGCDPRSDSDRTAGAS